MFNFIQNNEFNKINKLLLKFNAIKKVYIVCMSKVFVHTFIIIFTDKLSCFTINSLENSLIEKDHKNGKFCNNVYKMYV